VKPGDQLSVWSEQVVPTQWSPTQARLPSNSQELASGPGQRVGVQFQACGWLISMVNLDLVRCTSARAAS